MFMVSIRTIETRIGREARKKETSPCTTDQHNKRHAFEGLNATRKKERDIFSS